MLWSQTLIPTMKDVPADAEVPSHQLMLRAGLIRQLMAGAYTYLPLGLRALKKAEQIVREEMDAAGGVEILMPALQPIDLFERTGRREAFGNVLMNFQVKRGDRSVHLALGPTHEEVVTDLVSRQISSYRQLPLTLYQIQTKFRNEERPRFGVLRTSEFLMKDAYSFHTSVESLSETYQRIYRAYCRIFARCGLKYLPVEAESGPIGGDASHEFMIPADNGEDFVVHCPQTGYAANLERAETGRKTPSLEPRGDAGPLQEVSTPDVGSIDAVCKLLKCEPQQMIKTLIYLVDGKPCAVMVRGDHEVNENKLRRALNAGSIELADTATILKVTGAPVGFAGPVGIQCPLVADHDVPLVKDAISGANKEDAHLTGVNIGRDYQLETTYDIRNAVAGDPSPRGEGTLELVHGIEVGHVFKLGTKYSVALDAVFDDEKDARQPIIMGCYGIGVNRIVAGLAETCHDANGLVWPLAVAPYSVILCPLQIDDSQTMSVTNTIYTQLQAQGVDVLLDDRDQRAGVKFKDADLIGIPLRVVIGGKGIKEGIVEVKWRWESEPRKIALPTAVPAIIDLMTARRTEEMSHVPE